MFWRFLLLIAAAAIVGHTSAQAPQRIVGCFMGNWAVDRPDGFTIDGSVDAHLCTHFFYAFAGISADGGVYSTDRRLDLPDNGGLDGYAKFVGLKNVNPDASMMLSIGGGMPEISATFSQVAKSAELRTAFANNVYSYILQYGFEGLDVDWEYPAQNGGDPEVDKANYVLLLQAVRAKFDTHPTYLQLSAAVAQTRWSAGQSYDIPAISDLLDLIMVMCYDYHAADYSDGVGQNAPLYLSQFDSDSQLSVDDSISYWIAQGAPRDKIVMGMGMYGHTYTLADANNNGVGAPYTSGGVGGPVTNEVGAMGYNEICTVLNAGGWAVTYDAIQRVPYAVRGDQWIGYDNPESIAEKVNFIIANGLAGGMVWSIEQDDFSARCGGPRYPLLSTIKAMLNP